MLSKGGCRSEAGSSRDFIDGIICRFEQAFGIQQTLLDNPPMWRGSGLLSKTSGKGPSRHQRFSGKLPDLQRAIQMLHSPVQNRRKASLRLGANGMRRILGLTSLSMWWNNQAARNYIRDFCSVVGAHDMQAKIDSRGAASRRQDTSFIDVQNIGLDINVWKPRRKPIHIMPMRRCALAIEKTRSSQHKNA
jgi:hypothetical protein